MSDKKVEVNDMKYQDESGYQGAKKIGLQDALNADANDESLKKWKESLISKQTGAKHDKHVVFQKLVISSPGLPRKLEFSFDEAAKSGSSKDALFIVKGGEEFKIGFQYNVYNDVVMGLRVVQKVTKMLTTIAKGQTMMGCYAPQEKEHEFFLGEIDAPAAAIARGKYKAHFVFGDDDEGDGAFGELTFYFEIAKDWK